MAVPFCTSCGKEIQQDAGFCVNCGTKFQQTAGSKGTPEQSQDIHINYPETVRKQLVPNETVLAFEDNAETKPFHSDAFKVASGILPGGGGRSREGINMAGLVITNFRILPFRAILDTQYAMNFLKTNAAFFRDAVDQLEVQLKKASFWEKANMAGKLFTHPEHLQLLTGISRDSAIAGPFVKVEETRLFLGTGYRENDKGNNDRWFTGIMKNVRRPPRQVLEWELRIKNPSELATTVGIITANPLLLGWGNVRSKTEGYDALVELLEPRAREMSANLPGFEAQILTENSGRVSPQGD
jgi:hypothetical protein